jgi:hypothetical protein
MCGYVWPLAAVLAGGGVGAWFGVRALRVRRVLEHAESELAWSEFSRRLGLPFGAAASLAWAEGNEFYCRCGRREVGRKGDPPPTCQGVSCIGTEHEPRVMRSAAEP